MHCHSRDELTLERLETAGLSLKQQRELRQACPPIAGDHAVPVRQDLFIMWQKVERYIRALGTEIEPHRFN
jgi:hypothetical protein